MKWCGKWYDQRFYDKYTKMQFNWYSSKNYDGVRVNFSERIREWLFRQLELNCIHNGVNDYEIDHITPLYKNGSNKIDNLQILCYSCHKSKTKKDREIIIKPHQYFGVLDDFL